MFKLTDDEWKTIGEGSASKPAPKRRQPIFGPGELALTINLSILFIAGILLVTGIIPAAVALLIAAVSIILAPLWY